MWKQLSAVAGAGAVGGAVNALLGTEGMVLPRFVESGGSTVVVLGFVGNVFIGAVAAFISFGLYGPFADLVLLGTRERHGSNQSSSNVAITISALAGAILVGYSGGRWMTSEADGRFSQEAARETATALDELMSSAVTGTSAAPSSSAYETIRALSEDIQNSPPEKSLQSADELREAVQKFSRNRTIE